MRQQVVFWCLCVLMSPIWAAESRDVFLSKSGESFSAYEARANAFLQTHKEWVKEQDSAREVSAVMPFELQPDPEECAASPKVGVLLSHGLSDSPFSMRDPARALQAACYQVRVILLPGHGTRSSDLLFVDEDDWRDAFQSAADVFKQEVDVLYVGGFSTGGALAAEYAWQNPQSVAGVILFSPLFKINSSIDWLSPMLSYFKDWLDNYPTDDFAKYASIPVPAIASAYRLAKDVRNRLIDNPQAIPVFMALSEDDQTVDATVSKTVFKKAMVSSKSQMLLYSRLQPNANTDRVRIYNTNWPQQRILGLSHMAIHGDPQNTYYGEQGRYRICSWYLEEPLNYQACRSDQANWFGEKSEALLEKSKHAARVSWNPTFDSLMKQVSNFIEATVDLG
ncbi:alpha/beta hydrolase [Marinomonas pollencensis]|uniref:Esterase/lipase n=1 Tax=Marinomonas pollencensis TaxID=491954 RepID=A0A3E0DI61_9GAMM|nr:alpha/beta fold hydrolase [Marinomonas pollencensis]REG81138.1 esterase/lipase [Marinomonas pollencensis]